MFGSPGVANTFAAGKVAQTQITCEPKSGEPGVKPT